MKKTMMTAMVGLLQLTAFAETNATIEVKLFKPWVIARERGYYNFALAIKNTGKEPIRLFKDPVRFEMGQFAVHPLPRKPNTARENERQEFEYEMAGGKAAHLFFDLPPEETHVYEGRWFYVDDPIPFSEEMHFVVSMYLGKGFWLNSEPVTFKGVVPDSEEHIATISGVNPGQYELWVVTYKNERWLYMKTSISYFSVCPLSLTNKIRVEPHDGRSQHKIWDGDKSMIYQIGTNLLLEGPDENNVFGKWTRERKQRAEVDNAEVRRKKAEAAK